ncbi:MAG: dienelactone hydrolase, partial [Alphaproteobacteria bacterium]
AVLMVDSASPRGEKVTCGNREKRRKMYQHRPFDAYAALQYLQVQPFVLPDKIGLIGWSQGGGITLLTVVTKSIARPDPMTGPDFAVAAAFYPALCNDRVQSKPFTDVEPHSWSTHIPLLVLQGEADNWTKPVPCRNFIEEAAARGNSVSILFYPEAYHVFDAPSLKLIQLKRYKTIEGIIPIVGTNGPAREKALHDLPAFLDRYLK